VLFRSTRRDEKKAWDTEKGDLKVALDDAEIAAWRRAYWYTFGLLGGLVIAAVGGIGYLSTGDVTARRVFGGVVISTVLLLFVAYLLLSQVPSFPSRFPSPLRRF